MNAMYEVNMVFKNTLCLMSRKYNAELLYVQSKKEFIVRSVYIWLMPAFKLCPYLNLSQNHKDTFKKLRSRKHFCSQHISR